MWSEEGLTRLLAYSASFWTAAGLLLWLAPRYLGVAAAAAALAYTVWWTGPAAPLAVLYFLGSCFFLGRIVRRTADPLTAALLGVSIWMLVFWIALHFPVNTRWAYLAALALPYPWHRLQAVKWPRLQPVKWPRPEPVNAPLALLLWVLMAHWLLALKPEISSDGLSMHLALPAIVAHQARWPFDFGQYIWALMPNTVDALYAAVYSLGGEPAARLLNFAFLAGIAALIAQAARRWVPPGAALVAAALFASTPLAAMVTGSLFVENAWTALVLAGVLALLRYLDHSDPAELLVLGVLLGAALASKLIAAPYVAPLLLCAGAVALWRGQARMWLSLALFALFAAPPYAYSRIQTGNPVFPFANAVFQSPHYYSGKSFDDLRFHQPLSWRTPYDLTFRSDRYFEGNGGGGAGFQYFFLLAPAALLIRRRDQAVALAAGLAPALVILHVLPNLRHLYPSLAILSVVLSVLLRFRAAPFVMAGFTALNLWFLPAGDWTGRDFALFRKSDVAAYLERAAPERSLIARLNASAPGEPVAFFGTDTIAGLAGAAYSPNWHSEHYWERVRSSPEEAIAAYLRQLGIRHVVAPVARNADFPGVRRFLGRWIDPDGPPAGAMGLFRLRDAPLPVGPVGPGVYEDLDWRLECTQQWTNDHQFREATAASVTYTDVPGQSCTLRFNGSSLRYVYTRALNRGEAEIRIDGRVHALIDAYSARTQWQASRDFAVSGGGTHVFELRATGRKAAASSGAFVDIDLIEVR